MNIEYTPHFWEQFERRRKKAPVNLDLNLVEKTILKPDMVFPDNKNPSREWRVKKVKGYCLKVIVEKKVDTLIVITLFFDRGLRRKGLCK